MAASSVEFISEKKADIELMVKFNIVNKTLKDYQAAMFPKYRKAFSHYVVSMMKDKQCGVSLTGTNGRTLLVKGKYFNSEKNRLHFFNENNTLMLKYRFSALSFKWDDKPYNTMSYNIPAVEDDYLFSVWERYQISKSASSTVATYLSNSIYSYYYYNCLAS